MQRDTTLRQRLDRSFCPKLSQSAAIAYTSMAVRAAAAWRSLGGHWNPN
jgi:hypothetical protein